MFIDFSDFKCEEALDFEAHWTMRRKRKKQFFDNCHQLSLNSFLLNQIFLQRHESPATHLKGGN